MTTTMGVVDKNTGAIGMREVTISSDEGIAPTPHWKVCRRFAPPFPAA